MVTSFSAITAAVVALLQAQPAVSENVYRARERVIGKQQLTAVSVQWDGAIPAVGAIMGSPIDWQSKLIVECYARSTVTGGDEAVDPLLEAVYQRIAADTTLNNLVFDIGPPVLEAEYGADGEKTGWIRMTYLVAHRTKNFNLEPV